MAVHVSLNKASQIPLIGTVVGLVGASVRVVAGYTEVADERMSQQEGGGAGNDVIYSKQPSNVTVTFLEDTCGSAGVSLTDKGHSGAA